MYLAFGTHDVIGLSMYHDRFAPDKVWLKIGECRIAMEQADVEKLIAEAQRELKAIRARSVQS